MLNFKCIPLMKQTWSDLLFLHWPIECSSIRNHIPDHLEIDTYDGSAWIGIIPFRMSNLRLSFTFPLPYLSNFNEINLRTYVIDKYNRKGVWFFSLDTQNYIANAIANKFFDLNYRYGVTSFTSSNNNFNKLTLEISNANYKVQNFIWESNHDQSEFLAHPNSLEYFLTERYNLYTYNKINKNIYMGSIKHNPYKLYVPRLRSYDTDIFSSNGLISPSDLPHSILASKGTHVRVFPLKKVV